MKVSEALVEARALIEDEQSWTQGTDWRDAEGGEIYPSGWLALARDDGPAPGRPCQFCATGAVRWVCLKAEEREPTQTASTYTKALMLLNRTAGRLTNEHGRVSMAAYNDSASHADVLLAFDLAIATARIDEQVREQVKQSRGRGIVREAN